MSTYDYARELQAGAPTYTAYNPHAPQQPSYQNQPRIPGNNNTGEHRVKKVVKVWTCAKQHPTAALHTLRPGIKFEETFTCQTKEGSAMIYKVTVDGVTYQGAGTKSSVAKGIAAYNALVGIKANGVQFLAPICDIKAEEELVTQRLALYEQMQTSKLAKEQEKQTRKEDELMKQVKEIRSETAGAPKKAKDNNGQVRSVGNQMYAEVKQKYGPDVEVVYEEFKGEGGEADIGPVHQCTLKVQGFTFLAKGMSKKGACALAAGQAMERFQQDPPPHVNERKRKVPAPFVPKEPLDFPDKLAALCWSFVDTLTADKPAAYVKRRNLVCIVKVSGLSNEIEKCSVVAVGSGTLVIDQTNMQTDGSAINDSTGEALAARAFRTYILGQISNVSCKKASIFSKDRQGRISLKKDVRFLMYTNSCPMGDARYYGALETPPMVVEVPQAAVEVPQAAVEVPQAAVEPAAAGQAMEVETPAAAATPPARRGKYKEVIIKEEDKGKVQVFKIKLKADGTSMITESTSIPYEAAKDLHSIKSPSDKLLLRNMAGFQGALNSTLVAPLYISDYYVGRAYNEEALKRGLYFRAEGASKLAGPPPAIYQVTWKAEKMAQHCNPYAFIWCEGEQLDIIKTSIGMSIETGAPGETPSPSPYCTANFYKCYSEVSKGLRKAVKSYVESKALAEKYQLIKRSVLNKLELDGRGSFPVKAVQPAF